MKWVSDTQKVDLWAVSQWESGNAESAWLLVENAIVLGKVTKMSAQEDVEQPRVSDIWEVKYTIHANVGGWGTVVSTEKDHDANVVYPKGKAPYVSSVSKQEVPMTCLTQHHMPVQSTI
jgi:hypothetical protein